MIYLIGGPGRSGKTTLAWCLAKCHGIPFFSLDYLMMGLYRGAPCLSIDPNQPEATVTPKIWRVCRPMIIAMLENRETYCVEGFPITPQHVSELKECFPDDVRACFLGYCTVDPETKWEYEKRYRTSNSWDNYRPEDEAMAEVEVMKQASIDLKDQCSFYGYPFFDVSDHFEVTISKAESYLTKGSME